MPIKKAVWGALPLIILLALSLGHPRALSSDYEIPAGNPKCAPSGPPSHIPGHIGDPMLRSRYTSDVDPLLPKRKNFLPWCIEHRFFNELPTTGDPRNPVGDRALDVKWYDNETNRYFFESDNIPPQEESFGVTNIPAYDQHTSIIKVTRFLEKKNQKVSTQKDTAAFVRSTKEGRITPITTFARFFYKLDRQFIPINVSITSSVVRKGKDWVYKLQMRSPKEPVSFRWEIEKKCSACAEKFKAQSYTIGPKKGLTVEFASRSRPVVHFGKIGFFVPKRKAMIRFESGIYGPRQ